jgi:hypothetical protein
LFDFRGTLKDGQTRFLGPFHWTHIVSQAAVQWQLLHVEKDDQVIRHNNNKTWETKEKKASGKHFCSKHKVNIVPKKYLYRSAEKYLFGFAGLVLYLLFLYNFCHSPKKWQRYHPLFSLAARLASTLVG